MKAVSWADLFFRTPTLFPEHRPDVETTLPAPRYSILAMLEIPVR